MTDVNRHFTNINVSIAPDVKAEAVRALNEMDLTVSEYLRLAIAHVIEHGTNPFDVSPRARHRAHVPANCVNSTNATAAV